MFAGSAGFASRNWQDASSSGPVETSAGPPAGFGIEYVRQLEADGDITVEPLNGTKACAGGAKWSSAYSVRNFSE